MERKKLSGVVGLVFGTFAPMHVGHVDLIQTAKKSNTGGCLVLVSGTDTESDRGHQIGLGVSKRARYAREVFAEDPLVVVEKIDEQHIPAYPDGWAEWVSLVAEQVTKQTENLLHLTVYCGEEEYKAPLETYLVNHFKSFSVVVVDRQVIPISATAIRNNPTKHWELMTRPFRRHFTKKVLIVGSASTGKTTLSIDLARFFNAGVSVEYAREYQKVNNVRDEELNDYDYVHLFAGQYAQTQKLIDSGIYKLVIADTNSSVTMAYAQHYLRELIAEANYQMLQDLYTTTVSREQWDLILLVLPKTDYVDDGFRDMTMAGQETRDEFTETLKDLIIQQGLGDKLVVLPTTSTHQTQFQENYDNAKLLIENMMVGIVE